MGQRAEHGPRQGRDASGFLQSLLLKNHRARWSTSVLASPKRMLCERTGEVANFELKKKLVPNENETVGHSRRYGTLKPTGKPTSWTLGYNFRLTRRVGEGTTRVCAALQSGQSPMSSTNDGTKTPSKHSSRGSAVLVEGPSSTKGSTPVATPESGSGRRSLGHRSFLADSVSPRSASSRAGQTSALLERISRLQARLNERVSLAGLAHSSGPMQKRWTESDSLQEELRTPREASALHRDRIRELTKFNTPPSPSSVRRAAARDDLSARSALPHETESAPLSGHRADEVQSTDQKSMHARALDLEHALHTSETANRKLRSSLTQMQESFATQSAELSRVGMKLDASRKVQDTLRAQLKMLEAERNEMHLSASFQRKIYDLEKKLNDKERKIVKLEALLLSDSSSVRKTNVIESQGGA
ncbi:MAG: hypothetical protein ACPIOQ_25405, partial [Promethearchaeia archaeon]